MSRFLVIFIVFLLSSDFLTAQVNTVLFDMGALVRDIELSSSIAGDLFIAANPERDIHSIHRQFFHVESNKPKKIWDGYSKVYHFSRNGFVYVIVKEGLQVMDRTGKILKTYTTEHLKNFDLKSTTKLMSGKDVLFFEIGKDRLVKMPVSGFEIDFTNVKVIPYNALENHHKIGVDDEGRIYGMTKLPITSDEKGGENYLQKYGVNEIHENGDTSILFYYFVDNHGASKHEKVAFLSNGTFMVKINNAYCIYIDNKGKLIQELKNVPGTQHINGNTILGSEDEFLSITQTNGYDRQSIYSLGLVLELSDEQLLQRAIKAYEASKYDLAFQYADRAIKQNGSLADAFYIRGATRPGFRFYSEVKIEAPEYGYSIERLMLETVYRGLLGQEEAQREKIEKAVLADLILSSIKKSKYTAAAENQMGLIRLSYRDYEKAFQHFSKAAILGYQSSSLDANIIESALAIGMYEKILPKIEALIKNQPKNPEGPFFKGVVYYKTGAFEKAFKEFETAFLMKKTAFFLYHRGLANIALGRKENACDDLISALENGMQEAHYYVYQNCGYQAKEIGCNLCRGAGLLENGYDPIYGMKHKTCHKCGGHGKLLVEPERIKMDILLR